MELRQRQKDRQQLNLLDPSIHPYRVTKWVEGQGGDETAREVDKALKLNAQVSIGLETKAIERTNIAQTSRARLIKRRL